MSSGVAGINIEDARLLLQQLGRFQETIQVDWETVTIKWQNLQDSWQDNQRDKFEPIFDNLCHTYSESERQQEEYIQFLENLVRAAEDAIETGSINDPNSSEQRALTSNTSLGFQKFSKEPGNSVEENNTFLNTASQGINNILKGTSDFTRQTTATAMMFSALLGGCVRTYNDIVAPIMDIYDKSISTIAPDNFGFSIVSEALKKAKEEALGENIGDYEDLQVIQENEKKRREKEREVLDRVANEPKNSSF